MQNLRCKNCNGPIDADAAFCPNCGAPVEKQAGESDSSAVLEKKIGDEFKKGVETLKKATSEGVGSVAGQMQQAYSQSGFSSVQAADKPEILLSEGEEIVRSYYCASLRFQLIRGYLTVTNKRVIFNGLGTNSRIEKEVVINSVTGVDTYYGTNIRVFNIVAGAILVLFGLMMGDSRSGTWISFVFMFVGALVIWSGIKKTFVLAIYAANSNPSSINIGMGAVSALGNGAVMSLTANPTSETDVMMKEVGAMILDIQTHGDYAIEKWKK